MSSDTVVPSSRHLGYLIKKVQHRLRCAMDRELRSLSLTTPQYSVLSELEEFPGMSNADLARACFVTPQTMNSIVLGLDEAGLISRKDHLTHGRIQTTTLTAKGRERLRVAHVMVHGIEQEIFGQLDPRGQASLEGLLDALDRDSGPEAGDGTKQGGRS